MKRDRTDYMVVTSYLKMALKRQKLTYRNLAAGLSLSESGVKKILGARDGSFQRVSQICSYLGVTLADALSGAAESVLPVRFSEKQQRFLMGDAKAFALYWRLVYERESLTDAKAALGLSAKSGFSLLRKLDEHRLLKLLPGDRVRLPPVQLIRWSGTGPLVEKLYQEWSVDLVRSLARPVPPPNSFFLIRYFKVRPKTYADLMTALAELENEFVRRATQDMRTEAADLVHLRWVTAADDRSFLKN